MARLRARIVLPATAAGLLLLAGCGDPVDERPSTGAGVVGPSETTAAGSPVPGSAVPSPSFSLPGTVPSGGGKQPGPPPVAPTDLPTASGRPVVVDGVIEAGVEPGCRVLTACSIRYLLLGGGEDVPLGVPVRVQGLLQPGVLSTCQQGTPLRVTDVQRR